MCALILLKLSSLSQWGHADIQDDKVDQTEVMSNLCYKLLQVDIIKEIGLIFIHKKNHKYGISNNLANTLPIDLCRQKEMN